MTDIQALDSRYVAHTYARAPVTFVRGEGCRLYDEAGKAYIDMGSGIAVNALGYGDEGWVAAVSAQAGQLAHASNLYHTAPQALLAQRLCERTGLKRVFFGNSGAEANECAIKAARRYSALKHGENVRPVILTLENSFHGRTLATLAATGQDAFHHDFGPFPEGFRHVPANDADALKAALDVGDVCALLIETIQGEGGVNCLTEEYIRAAREMTEARDILLMIDEVQTGNGRTGKLYSYQHFGIQPDVVSTAKGLAGGLPMGACLLSEKAADVLTPGTHGSTFGGSPAVCAGALTILDRIDEALLEDVKAKSAYLFGAFAGKPGIKAVTGLGLMIGLETEKPAAEIVAKCREQGVLVLTAHDRVRLLPALNIPIELVKKAAEVIIAACA